MVVAAALIAVAVGGAFALGVFAPEPTILDDVPAEADAVAHIDGEIVGDGGTRDLGNAALATAGFDTATVGGVLGLVRFRTGLSAGAVQEAAVYARYDDEGRLDEEYAAAVVHANWTAEALVSATESVAGWEYDPTTVGDVTIHRATGDPVAVGGVTVDPLTIAVLDEGEFVVGTETAVRDAVAVANGSADALDGDVRTAATAGEEGLVTVAANVSGAWTAELDAATGGVTRLDRVEAVAVTYDTVGDDAAGEDAADEADADAADAGQQDAIVVRARFHTAGTEAARDVAAFARGGLPVLEHRADNATAVRALDAATVERSGTDATVTLETTIGDLREIAAHYGPGGA